MGHGRGGVPLVCRFWAKVSKSDDCWLWTAHRDDSGYGLIYISGRTFRRAHRISWELHNGPIPAGLLVLHRCDARLCVRPDHLILGTNAENMADMVRKRRARNGSATIRGEAHGMARLTEANVLSIRARVAAGELQKSVAQDYGICHQMVWNIVRGIAWRHLSEPKP